MVIINSGVDQKCHQKFQNGRISFQNPGQDHANKRKSFEIFLKEKYSDVASKYTFLPSHQIKKRVLDMWKKMSHGSNNPQKVEETPKRKKRQFTKKATSFNNEHSTSEPKKSARQPLKSKALVPLEVDVVPAPLKGVLKREKKTVDSKRVSFDCVPEVRYRTASETSSTSTLKSIQSLKETEDNGLYFNSETATKHYSSEMWRATNKGEKSKSAAEKKFEDLLNDKCSWTYKSIKTIQCQTSRQTDEKSPMLQIRTVNIEETAYNGCSHQKNEVGSLDEYEYIEADTKKTRRKVKLPRKSRNSKIHSTKGNRNTSQPKETFDERKQMNNIKTKLNKRNVKDVRYVESDSSSDDGLVFLSRRYDERMVNVTQCESDGNNSFVNEFPPENSSNIPADESNYNISDSNNIEIPQENYTEMDNFESQTNDEMSALEMNSDLEEEDRDTILDFLINDDYFKNKLSRNSIENQIREEEIYLSETLSSLSEWGSYKFQEGEENVDSKNDQNSEIIQQFMTVNREVQAICNELEAPNDDDVVDEIVSDFFGGNFEVEKYITKFNTDKTAAISAESNEHGSNKFELQNKIMSDDSTLTYSDSGIRSNEEILKGTSRHTGNANGTKEKYKKTNSENETLSNARNSFKAKERHTLWFDGDSTSSGKSSKDDAGNDVVGDENLATHSIINSPNTYSNSGIRSNEKIRKRINNNSDNTKNTKENGKENNSKNKNASNVRNSLRVKEQHKLYCEDESTSSGQSINDEAGNNVLGEDEHSVIHPVMDSPKTYSDRVIRSNKTRKYFNKTLDNAIDTKVKSKESDNKINSKNKNTSSVRSSKKVKEQPILFLDSDRTLSGQSNVDETGNDSPEENKYPETEDYFKDISFNAHEMFNKNLQKLDDYEKSKFVAEIEQNAKNRNVHQLLDKIDTTFTFPKKYDAAQQSATLKMEVKENAPLGNIKDGRNAKCTKKNAPKTWEDLEADILNREEQINFFPIVEAELPLIGETILKDENFHHKGMNNKHVQKLDDYEKCKSVAKLEQNAKNRNGHQLLDKSHTTFTFPKKYDVAQQSATSKMEMKENVPLGNIKDDRSAKCTKKKAPKTWEDLEADVLNREKQINFFPIVEAELPLIGETILKDENLHHKGMNKNASSSHKPEENFEIINTKTQNKWHTVKSEQGYSGQLVNRRNVKNDVTVNSPNASLIERVIRRMQLLTSPILTPSKAVLLLEEHQEGSVLTAHSYSVQETKSVFFTTEKNLDENHNGQSKTTRKACLRKIMMPKNYRLCKKREIKTVINPKGASITNQSSVKLNEIPKKKKIKLSNSSDSDDDSLPESSEMKHSTPESDKSVLLPQDSLAPNGSYNLRIRKCKDNGFTPSTTKKQSIRKVNNVTKSNSVDKYKENKTKGKQSLNEKPTKEDSSNENSTLMNEKKTGNKRNFMSDSADESEQEDLSQNGASSIDGSSDEQNRYLQKHNSNRKLLKMSHGEMSSQTNALLGSGSTKVPAQSVQEQVDNAKKSMKAERSQQDSKEEYEKYLQKLFSEDLPEDFYVQREFQDGTNETSERNLQKKDGKSYFSGKKLFAGNSDVELFSLSSDSESEVEKPSQRRASGLLDDVFK